MQNQTESTEVSANNDKGIVVALFSLLLAPITFLLGILSYREYEKYKEEQMIMQGLHGGGPIPPEAEIEIGAADPPEPKTEQVKCGLCGETNEVPLGKPQFECSECGNMNDV